MFFVRESDAKIFWSCGRALRRHLIGVSAEQPINMSRTCTYIVAEWSVLLCLNVYYAKGVAILCIRVLS